MLREVALLLLLVGWVAGNFAQDLNQVEGLRSLLIGLDNGVIATCNIVFFSELVTYDEADNNCKSFDIGSGRGEEGNLVTVDDKAKNGDLQTLLEMAYPKEEQDEWKWGGKRWVWAGLRKTKNTNLTNVERGDYNPLDWEWANGSHPTNFSKWLNFNKKKAQPDQMSIKKGSTLNFDGDDNTCDEDPRCFQNQMRINHNGKWDDTYKFRKHPYACDYKGKYILSNVPKTWESAKDACEDAGLHLAKVRNPDEVDEMKAAMNFFLGPADDSWNNWNSNNWIWMGGDDLEEEGIWRYLDGEMVETWEMPWRKNAGKDDAKFLEVPGRRGQHALAISRWGEFDDSFHDTDKRMRPFACQCPGS
jgi:hypothetical protein